MIKCVIIDDEPLASDVIESYLNKIGGVDIVAKTHNPLEAIGILTKNKVDLVFLDIEMPNLNGIDLVKSIENIPQFIFTTAYPQYALDGFNLNATDYLVKPIPFHRFIKAMTRAKEKYEMSNRLTGVNFVPATPNNTSIEDSFIFVKSEYENVKIEINNIQYIQGLKDYLKIYKVGCNKAIITLSSFKDILDKLPQNQFLRIHRSFVVNVNYIKALQKTKVVIDDIRIPIGETYKGDVLKRLGV